ncbi:39S ribosomal protein L45, mitochondrial [Rhizophlyctis rosea]|nr:39S ribosomal protein L45, mitochondrial [Rhizophlyctis rosea]
MEQFRTRTDSRDADPRTWQIRKAIKGWKAAKFAPLAEEKYIEFNQAYARADREMLRELVTDGMYATLGRELKHLSGVNMDWQSHGRVKPPATVNITSAKVMMDKDTEHKIAQVTVRVNLKQTVAVYKDGKLIGGDPKNPQDIEEYIVMEKWLTRDPFEEWKIAARLNKEQ